MPIKLSTTDNKNLSEASFIVGLWPDSRNRTTGQSNCVIQVSDFVSADQLDSRGYSTITYVDNKDTQVVHKSSAETISGAKTFTGGVTVQANALTLKSPTTISNTLTIQNSAVEMKSATHVYAPNPVLSADKNSVATLQTFDDKFKVVSALPSNPDPNTFYFVLA